MTFRLHDNISSFVGILNNAVLQKKRKCYVSVSKTNAILCDLLLKRGFILGYQFVFKNSYRPLICIFCKFHHDINVIHSIKRISRPGLRINYTFLNLKQKMKYLSSGGEIILSTSKGIKLGHECLITGVSGEALFSIN